MEYWFYHLEHTSLEAALPLLLQKSLANSWRVRIEFSNKSNMIEMDRYLWTFKDDSFLPHGREDQPLSEMQPILLSDAANLAREDVVFLVGGAQEGTMEGVQRCITMVDSRDEDGRAIARQRWAKAKKEGREVSYWRQDDRGAWKKQS